MSNSFYNTSGAPSQGSSGSSAVVRAEFAAIVAAFDKMPTLGGNAGQVVTINSGATGLTTSSAITVAGSDISVGGSISAGVSFKAALGNAAAPSYTFTGRLTDGLFSAAANAVAVAANGIEQLRVTAAATQPGADATKTLGTSALRWLSVFGSEFSDGASATNQLVGSSAGTARFGFGSSWTGFSIATGGSARITANNAGNVTINAPSSGTALTVNSVAGTGLSITDATHNFAVQIGGTNYAGNSSNHPFGLITNNAERVLIAAAGNVTVNAPSSGATVVVGALAATNSQSVQMTGSTTGANILRFNSTGGNYYIGPDSSTGGAFVAAGSAYCLAVVTESARDIQFATNNILRATLSSNGNLTVGPPTSGITLTAASSTTGEIARYSTTANAATGIFVRFIDNSATDRGSLGSGTGYGGAAQTDFGMMAATGQTLALGANNTRYLTVSTAGLVDMLAGSGSLRTNGHISRFESAEQTCPTTNLTTMTIAHGGSRAPDNIYVILRCKTAELGYSVGDELFYFEAPVSITDHDYILKADGTNIGFVYISNGTAPVVRNYTTGATAGVTAGNWRVVFKATWL